LQLKLQDNLLKASRFTLLRSTRHTVAFQQWFDRLHGKGASARLRSMLDEPQFAYQEIANKFGLTRQYIAQLANELGINGRQRQRERERMRRH